MCCFALSAFYLCFLSSCIFWRVKNFCFMGSVITMAYLKSCFIQQNWKHNIPSASGRKYDLGKMYYFKTYFETLRSFRWEYPSVFIFLLTGAEWMCMLSWFYVTITNYMVTLKTWHHFSPFPYAYSIQPPLIENDQWFKWKFHL